MATALVVIHLLMCIFLVFVILLQPGKGDGGIGFGGSSSQSIFGSRGAGNFLTKTTGVCAMIFLLTSFVLTRSRIAEHKQSVISGETPPAAASPAPGPGASPAAAAAPAATPLLPPVDPAKK
jgi:preprotein translocase subunit SecG